MHHVDRYLPCVVGIICRQYVGGRMEPCGTPAGIPRGGGISLSSENANFAFERKQLIILTVLAEELKFHNLHNKQGAI